MARRLAAIMAADMVGFSRLMAADENGTIERQKAQRQALIDPKVEQFGGRIVKTTGDGLLIEFPSVVDAVQCAVEIQLAMPEREREIQEDQRIRYRIGVNLGDIVIDGEDILGDGVNVAARLEAMAEPGGLCISDNVHQYLEGKIPLTFTDLGEKLLKNLPRPQRIWGWSPEVPSATESRTCHEIGSSLKLPDQPSIAVLPFNNMSDDPEQQYFSDGITEDIIIDLSKLSNLRVAARNSSFLFRNAQMTFQEIASKLNVDFVVEGSIRKSGENVRITAQLIDVHADAHIWAERYDRELSNIFELQDEITTSIVEALKVKILPQDEEVFEKYATHDVEAYENYLRARSLLREMTRRSVELAQRMFKQAVSLDKNYALAYCGLADCASTLAYHYDVEKDLVEESITYSQKALEIDPRLGEAHAAYGKALELKGDLKGAEQEYLTAIDLEPNSHVAYFYLASLYLHARQADKAQPLYMKAFELADHDLQTAMMLSGAYRTSGNTKELEKIARRTVEISEHRLRMNPEDERAAYVGATALIDLGDLERAKKWADLAVAISVEDSRTSYNLACLYGVMGDVEEALVHLEKTLRMGCSSQKREWMQRDGDLAHVRENPRFDELLRQYD